MKNLNPSQLEAVNHETGPLLVVAGAGTGKTSLITARIVNLINEKNIHPDNILAVTFTEKAAKEMLGRLDEVMPLSYYEPKIATYHAFCQEVLRNDGHEMGLNTNFKLITDAEQWMLLRKEIYTFALKELRPKNNPSKYISDLLRLFSKCVDENVTSNDLIRYSLTCEDETEKKKWEEVSFLFDKYQELKLRDSKMDFGDLITFTYRLFLEKPFVLKKYQEKYQHVLVDEFQDTNYTQYNLIKLLCSPESLKNRSLVVVGDDSQSIYKFRGAAISNILEFKKDYGEPKIVTLIDNYRSVQEILDVSYKVIKNNDPYTLESMLGISKKLKSNVDPLTNSEISVVKCNDLESEVSFVVSKIKEVLNTNPNFTFKDIAILVRANSHLEPFILELKKERIPYQVYGNKGLYDKEEVSTAICLLNLLIDPTDNNNLLRCLFIETLNIDQELILKLLANSKSKKTILWSECESSLDKNIRNFVNLVKKYQKHLTNQLPSDLMFKFLQDIKYVSKYSVEENLENELAIKNLNLFLKRMQEIERSMLSENNLTPNLVEFMDYFNLIVEAGENPAQAEFEDLDTVNLLTVHSSKGLEFECVFIPSLINGRFPSTNRGSSFDIPTELIEGKEILPKGDYFLQEERRLFYVGVTRAKKYLNLSFSLNYGKRERAKSLFLEETGLEVVDYVKETDQEETSQESLFDLQDNFKKRLAETKTDYKIKTLSFTALTSYKSCPLKYKYQFILNIPTKQSKALSFGNTIHETLKEYHQQKVFRKVSLNELLDMYKKNWQPYGFEDRENQIEYYKNGVEILTKYYEKYNEIEVKSKVIEKNFKFKLGDIDVTGKIDRIDLLPDGKYEIIDYKTGQVKKDKEVREDNQLTMYKLAASEVFGYDVEKLTYFFVEDDVKISTERNEKDIENLKSEVIDVTKKIQSNNFTATPSRESCNFCDFKEICPSAFRD